MKAFTYKERREFFTTHQVALDIGRARFAVGFVTGTLPDLMHTKGLNNSRVWNRQVRVWRFMAGAQVYRSGAYPGL